MRSLRARLGALVAVGALVLTLAATVAVAVERWQESVASLPAAVEFEAFQRTESDPNIGTTIDFGVDPFVLVYDEFSEVIASQGNRLDDSLRAELADEVWPEVVEQDISITYTIPAANGRSITHVSGVQCVRTDLCDTVIVGASEEPFGKFATDRWYWILGPGLVMALLGLLSSRWLVGRSLQPVEAMRRELAAITATNLDRRVPVPRTDDELADLGSTFNDTIGRLESAAHANEQFVADAAHELRSPITGVRAALEVEAMRNDSGLIQDSVAELDRAGRLIDDLLISARRHGPAPAHTEVDLDELARSEMALIASRYPQISVFSSIEPARVIGDSDGLRRVIANLLENACRYGESRVNIELKPNPGGGAMLTVDDDGPGVPEHERERIFARFTRLDEARDRASGGSGLGLAIVRELVFDHGGKVTVDDGPLGGARFAVTL